MPSRLEAVPQQAMFVMSANAAKMTFQPANVQSNRRQKANIRANKPVPECRAQSHAVADDPLDGSLNEPERDGSRRTETTCDGIELPGSQEARGFESLRLHPTRKSR